MHYHQLNIPQIESKRSKSEILNIVEHHNYIEYILQSHNIKSEIDYFSHSLIAPEIKILPFAFFVIRKDFNIIIDTRLLQFIREFKINIEKKGEDEANEIFSEKVKKYFNYLTNPKYLENIQSYFIKRRIINSDQKIKIIAILPTVKELEMVSNFTPDNYNQYFELIDSGDLYQFLS